MLLTRFLGCGPGDVCRQKVVIFSIFVGQNVGQTVGYGIGIAAQFVRQSPKSNSKQYRSSNTDKDGPGGMI